MAQPPKFTVDATDLLDDTDVAALAGFLGRGSLLRTAMQSVVVPSRGLNMLLTGVPSLLWAFALAAYRRLRRIYSHAHNGGTAAAFRQACAAAGPVATISVCGTRNQFIVGGYTTVQVRRSGCRDGARCTCVTGRVRRSDTAAA